MAMADDLDAKVQVIERLALEWYELYMRQFGFTWDGNGSVMLDPERPQPPSMGVNPPLSVEEQTRPMQQNWSIFKDDLQTMLDYFRSFYTLAPHEVTVVTDRIGGSAGDVGNGTSSSVHDRLALAFDPWLLGLMKLVDTGNWTGPAADTFQHNFVDPFNRMGQIQMACVRELGLTALGWNNATEAAVKNLHEIADACIYRMEHPAGLSSKAVHILSIVSIATGFAAFVAPIAIPAGVVSVSTAVYTYFDAINKELEPDFAVDIGGTTPHETVLSTYGALKAVATQLMTFDDGLAGALEQDLTGGQAFTHPSIRLPQPGSSDLDGGLGTLDVGSARLVTSIVELYRAGDANLPIIADQYAAAASILGGCAVPAGVYRFLSRSAGKFDDGVDLLVRIFGDTRDRAAAAGEALVRTANEYQLTDSDRAEVLRQIAEQQTPWVGDEPERAGGV